MTSSRGCLRANGSGAIKERQLVSVGCKWVSHGLWITFTGRSRCWLDIWRRVEDIRNIYWGMGKEKLLWRLKGHASVYPESTKSIVRRQRDIQMDEQLTDRHSSDLQAAPQHHRQRQTPWDLSLIHQGHSHPGIRATCPSGASCTLDL